MHSQLFLLALVAPLALSLPQPISRGQSDILIARHGSGNSTGGDSRWHGKHGGPPGGHHPERALIEGKGPGNSTEEGHSRPHEHHEGPPHKARDLSERQHAGNSTGAGPDDHKAWKHHGPPHPERDLSDRQTHGNSTDGDRRIHPEFRHHSLPGAPVEKRIEEANGTTAGHVGHEKFRPDGHHGGPGEHKRSLIDVIFDRR